MIKEFIWVQWVPIKFYSPINIAQEFQLLQTFDVETQQDKYWNVLNAAFEVYYPTQFQNDLSIYEGFQHKLLGSAFG